MPEHAEVSDTKAFFVQCLTCERDPMHPWDRSKSPLFDDEREANVYRLRHDREYHDA